MSPRSTLLKVFRKNSNCSACKCNLCAWIVVMFGQEHRQATAKIPEMAMCSRSSNFSLALKMVTCEIPRQYEMSSVSRLMAVSIICRKWGSVTFVEAKFRLVRYLKTLHGIKRYKLRYRTDPDLPILRCPSVETF